jgi:hypothetical protein
MIILDKSRVPIEKQKDPRLLESERQLSLTMRNYQSRLNVCLHEVAHAVYLERGGAKRLIFHPPFAWYRADTDAFDIANMAVQGDFEEGMTKVDLMAVARWHVAGGVVGRTMTPSFYYISSDSQDFEGFCIFAQECSMTPKNIQKHWNKAKEDVSQDLCNPAFQRELKKRARALEKAMFDDTGAPKGIYIYYDALVVRKENDQNNK